MYPVLQGNSLAQSDIVQVGAMAHEANEFAEKTGETTMWTGRMFSGMPMFQIWFDMKANLPLFLLRTFQNIFPSPIDIMLIYLLGFYVLLIAIGANRWLAMLGAIAFSFASYNISIIEAGHVNKAMAIGLVAPTLAGIYKIFRGKYLSGLVLTALMMAIQIRVNHLQITYYMGILVVLWGAFELFNAIKNKTTSTFFKGVGIAVIAVILGVLPNITSIWSTYTYAKETIRGQQELSSKKVEGNGLNLTYATRWSYGIDESFTLLIPNFKGGSSAEKLDESSATFEVLTSKGVPKKQAESFVSQLPMYWGDQPGIAGTTYYGATVLFLLVLALIIVKDRIKYWLLLSTVFCLMISWGHNFEGFYMLFFKYLPMFNKFRAPTMILAVGNVTLVWLVILGIKEILDNGLDFAALKKPMIWAVSATAGLSLFFAVAGSGMFDFRNDAVEYEGAVTSDERFTQQMTQMTGNEQFGNAIMDAIIEDRASMLTSDAFRSVIFILLAAAIIFLMAKKSLKSDYALMLLAGLILVDLWAVDKRMLNDNSFSKQRKAKNEYPKSAADMAVLADTDPNFRVLNLATSTFNDAMPSYHYKTIGGYHAAKLKRYQDLIERHISPEIGKLNQGGFANTPVLNMLNTKYAVTGKEANSVFANQYSLGNAWFVNSVKFVATADEEIDALNGFNPSELAIVNEADQSYLAGFNFNHDANASITFDTYKPNFVSYKFNSSKEELVVFSEIFYRGNEDWISTIDGKSADHFRVNYVLRAMRVPAGEHIIEFEFKPASYYTGEKFSQAGSAILLILMLLYVFRSKISFLKDAE